MEYPAASPKANVPTDVTGDPAMVKPVGTVIETDVTVPSPVPAPIAALKETESNAEIVLFALNRGKVTDDGFVNVNRFCPIVVPPRDVLPVAATNPDDPPSHLYLSAYAADHSFCDVIVGIE